MIRREVFFKAITEVLLLTGQNPKREQIEAIYRRVQNFEEEDFLRACEDDELLDSWATKVNYPALRKTIEKYMIERLDAECREQKKREREELKAALRSGVIPEEIKKMLVKIKSL